ncbi:trypsin-like peptidase domain-containing protein [Candidatus Saccharibacteria bacterium]|nr:trypsin-like peptidase domain-containing protein [Candidatus Saccharibacteria bacterium]
MPTKTESIVPAQTKIAKPLNLTRIIVISVISGLLAGLLGAFLYLQIVARSSKPLPTGLSKKEIISQDNAIIDVAKKASPSVVSIVSSSTATNFFGQSQQQQAAGTGIVVKDNGLILTNKHVVQGAQSFTIIDSGGKQYQAKVAATDPTNDLAFLKAEASGLTPATLGDSESVQVGETVITIGNALGQFQNSVTTGIISGKGRPITAGDQGSSSGTESLQNLFQTDAAINPGNSGGPLLDIGGNVIGVNTAVAGEGSQNIGFAIPINEVKNDLASFNSTGKIIKPYLGVRYVSITKDIAKANGLPVENGAFVQGTGSVVGGSPAASAGLEQGDIITKINNTEINADNQLTSVVGKFKPGDTVTLTVVRQGKTITIKAKLGEAPSS